MSHPSFASEPITFENADEEKEYRTLLSQSFASYPEQCEKALEIFSQMDQRWPYDPQVLGWLGVVHRELGNLDLAIKYLELTVQVSPTSELASTALFLALQEAQEVRQDFSYGDRSIDEASRFIVFATGKPSVEYGYILKDMLGEYTDEEHQKHTENLKRGVAHLEKPYVPKREHDAEDVEPEEQISRIRKREPGNRYI